VMLPKPLNRFFQGLLELEAQLMRVINFPFGTSIIMLARRV